MENIFKGLGVALVTPFDKDGEVNYSQLAELIEYQLASGVDFLCALGSTAETSCLFADEKAKIKRLVVEQVRGRVPVLLGFGGNCTRQLLTEMKEFDMTGVDGILSVCPYYNKPTQEGIYLHYKHQAEATSLPLVLYNIPGRSGVNILPETLIRLAHDVPNIVGVKEASGNIEQVDCLLDAKPDHFDVISGDDSFTYEFITMGAVGVISVMGNAFPELFGRMVHHLVKHEDSQALKIHRHLFEFYRLLFVDGNPAGIKCLLSKMGRMEKRVRLPLVPVRKETEEKITEAYQRYLDNQREFY